MTTWDEFERSTAFRRPSDWRDRPDGPDALDWFAANTRAYGMPISRGGLIAAMGIAPQPPDR